MVVKLLIDVGANVNFGVSTYVGVGWTLPLGSLCLVVSDIVVAGFNPHPSEGQSCKSLVGLPFTGLLLQGISTLFAFC